MYDSLARHYVELSCLPKAIRSNRESWADQEGKYGLDSSNPSILAPASNEDRDDIITLVVPRTESGAQRSIPLPRVSVISPSGVLEGQIIYTPLRDMNTLGSNATKVSVVLDANCIVNGATTDAPDAVLHTSVITVTGALANQVVSNQAIVKEKNSITKAETSVCLNAETETAISEPATIQSPNAENLIDAARQKRRSVGTRMIYFSILFLFFVFSRP